MSQKFCNILVHTSLQCIYLMTKVVKTMKGIGWG